MACGSRTARDTATATVTPTRRRMKCRRKWALSDQSLSAFRFAKPAPTRKTAVTALPSGRSAAQGVLAAAGAVTLGS